MAPPDVAGTLTASAPATDHALPESGNGDASAEHEHEHGHSAEDEFPRVFGRYLLLKRLSRGGMGEIFLAKVGEIEGFEKLVIIKKILPNLAADQEFIKRFIDEAQVAIKLNHANIAPVTEVGRVDGEYFLAIGYIEGRDLRRVIVQQRDTDNRMPVETCLYIGRELSNGLAYAHRRTDDQGASLAVVHCDISPPNVMVSYEGEVKIIDFGIAKSAIRIAGTNPNMGFGKFGYMAPEQVVRGGIVDKRTDIYAAGVVVYELLTGQRLFQFPDGADYRQIARIVTSGKVVPPSVRDPNLDPSLDAIIMKALQPRGADRYQSAEEFRDALQMKLAQIAPAFSADNLASYVRELFQDELTEERQLVASLRAVDVAPYQEELTAATTAHTVTFARSGLARISAAKAAAAGANDTEGHSTATFAPISQMPFFLKVISASVVGAVAMFGISRLRTPPPMTSTPMVGVATPPPPEPTQVTVPTATVTQLPTHDPVKPHPKPTVVTRHEPEPVKKHEPVATKHEPEPPKKLLKHATQDSVEEKFRAVRKEYAAFRNQYGAVLEERWQTIANEVTFGKSDKYERVDTMLDALRREMSRVRDGG